MATDTSAPGGRSPAMNPDLMFGAPEWLKLSAQTPMTVYGAVLKASLEAAARTLHDQAGHLERLAACTSPTDALKCQWEFVQASWPRPVQEGTKLLEVLRTNAPAVAPRG